MAEGNTSPSNTAPNPHHVRITSDTAEDDLLYAYNVNPKSKSYLEKADKIFKISSEDYEKFVSRSTRVREAEFEYRYSDAETTASQKIATEMGVKGCYGVFSGAASMSLGTSNSSKTKTVRYDYIAKAKLFTVDAISEFSSFPEKFLTETFKNSVATMTNEQMEERLGTFYASKISFGGLVEKSFIMDAFSDDNEITVKAALSAGYGKGKLYMRSLYFARELTHKNSRGREVWASRPERDRVKKLLSSLGQNLHSFSSTYSCLKKETPLNKVKHNT
jgi:hypothetical protein